jgi:hypothetical protein
VVIATSVVRRDVVCMDLFTRFHNTNKSPTWRRFSLNEANTSTSTSTSGASLGGQGFGVWGGNPIKPAHLSRRQPSQAKMTEIGQGIEHESC